MVSKLAPLVVVVGPTASGKSALGMELARKFNGEIICADSRTIYKRMDIGTAKPSKRDQAEIPHHMLDIVEPGQRYSAAQFKEDALSLIDDIWSRGKLPIMVGGTGLYIDAVIFDYKFSSPDAERDPLNPRHLKRDTSQQQSELRENTLVIGMTRDREVLNNRIEQRMEQMVENGFVDEVKQLLDSYGPENEAMSGIGYKTFAKYIRGELTLDDAKAEFIKGDKSLAKRQRTWFKRNKGIHWVTNNEQAVELVTTLLQSNE